MARALIKTWRGDKLTVIDKLKINDLILLLSSMDGPLLRYMRVFRIMQNVQVCKWNILCASMPLISFPSYFHECASHLLAGAGVPLREGLIAHPYDGQTARHVVGPDQDHHTLEPLRVDASWSPAAVFTVDVLCCGICNHQG